MPVGAKVVDLGITRVWWLTAIAALPVVKLTEVTAGVELSKALLPDYTFGADASTTISERDITALYDSDTPTIGKYKGSLHLFRKMLPAGTAGTDDLLSVFTGQPHGYLVRRIGPPVGTAPIVGDVVDVGEFIADFPQQEAGTGSGFLKLTVPLLSQGYYFPAVSLT